MEMSPSYGYTRSLPGIDYNDAVPKAIDSLATEGFGVLTQIEVKATLKKKLGTDSRNYLILSPCNPSLALEALTVDPAIGLLLPCNVVVTEDDDGNAMVVAIRPSAMFTIVNNSVIELVAAEVDAMIKRTLEAL